MSLAQKRKAASKSDTEFNELSNNNEQLQTSVTMMQPQLTNLNKVASKPQPQKGTLKKTWQH